MSTNSITFSVNCYNIVEEYDAHNKNLPSGESAYSKSNPIQITQGNYTSTPAPDSSGAVDIGDNTSITISVDNNSTLDCTIDLSKFDNLSGTLIPDTKNPGSGDSIPLTVTPPKTSSHTTETYDINFTIKYGSSSYYCTLDPKLRANQGQNS